MVTLEQVKNMLGIPTIDTSKDEQINALIPLVYGWIKGYCNITDVPEEYDLNAVKMIEYNLNKRSGLSSESLSRHSVSFETDFPAEITKGLRRRLRW